MAAIDKAAPEPVEVLIERAGSAVARLAREMLGGTYGRTVNVIVGKGNNGNDGRAAAALLARGACGSACSTPLTARRSYHRADLVIDAAYGTGFHGEWRAPRVGAAPVLAVDIPSGVNGLTGEAGRGVLAADRTVTFAALKPGLLLGAGRNLAGDVEVVDIGLDTRRARAHARRVRGRRPVVASAAADRPQVDACRAGRRRQPRHDRCGAPLLGGGDARRQRDGVAVDTGHGRLGAGRRSCGAGFRRSTGRARCSTTSTATTPSSSALDSGGSRTPSPRCGPRRRPRRYRSSSTATGCSRWRGTPTERLPCCGPSHFADGADAARRRVRAACRASPGRRPLPGRPRPGRRPARVVLLKGPVDRRRRAGRRRAGRCQRRRPAGHRRHRRRPVRHPRRPAGDGARSVLCRRRRRRGCTPRRPAAARRWDWSPATSSTPCRGARATAVTATASKRTAGTSGQPLGLGGHRPRRHRPQRRCPAQGRRTGRRVGGRQGRRLRPRRGRRRRRRHRRRLRRAVRRPHGGGGGAAPGGHRGADPRAQRAAARARRGDRRPRADADGHDARGHRRLACAVRGAGDGSRARQGRHRDAPRRAAPADVPALVARIAAAAPAVRLAGIFTHLAVADEADDPYTAGQLATFDAVLARPRRRARRRGRPRRQLGRRPGPPGARRTFVRAGIAITASRPAPASTTSPPCCGRCCRCGPGVFVKRLDGGGAVVVRAAPRAAGRRQRGDGAARATPTACAAA